MVHDTRRLAPWLAGLTVGLIACNRPVDTSGVENPSSCAEQGGKACEVACDGGDGAACLVASIPYREKQRETMMRYELQACDQGVPQGCEFYANNFTLGADTDLPKAREYFQRACEGGQVRSCTWLVGDALGPTDDGNERQMRDPAAARAAWTIACTHEPTACGGLADLETLGLGGPKDPDSARQHYTSACEANDAPACHNLETTDPELQLHSANFAMLEIKIARAPNFDVRGAMPGQVFTVGAVVCFDASSFNPIHASITRKSDSAAMDAGVIDTMLSWRARPRQPFPEGIAACVPMIYDFKLDPHIRAKFGS